jgi:hypothetical protein
MTVFIPVRDQLTWLIPLAEFVARSQNVQRVVLVDNDSTYPAMRDWLRQSPYEVSYGPNTGHLSPYHRGLVDACQTSYYAITDPDLELHTLPRDWPERFVSILERYGRKLDKVGVSLRTDDVDFTHPEVGPMVTRTQLGHWDQQLAPGLWIAPIDTTLFVARRDFTRPDYGPAVRVAGRYMVRHLPWYLSDNCPPDVRYYFAHVDGWCSGHLHYRAMIGIKN